MTPSLRGIDDGFLSNGGLLHSELRDETNALWTMRPTPARSADVGGPEILRDALGNALKATREAFFDGSDSVNVSIAGVELSATWSGERRGVSVNGYDLPVSSQDVAQANYIWQPSAAPVAAPGFNAAASSGVSEGRNILAEIRRLVFHPMTVIGAIALAVLWLVAVAWDRSGSQD